MDPKPPSASWQAENIKRFRFSLTPRLRARRTIVMQAAAPLLFGYARVSTDDQNLDLQRDALLGHGVPDARIYSDKASGKSLVGRPSLAAAIKALRSGDVLVVWKLDRLGRNLEELILTVRRIQERGAHFRCLTQPIDTSTPMGTLIFHIFGAMAQFERELGVERTKAGLAAARARGRVGGRRPVLTEDNEAKARRMFTEGKKPAEIAAALKISKSTIYKWRRAVDVPPVHDPETDEVSE
jgi:DNA invertase Pin-like site-specific DNA recombinase